jgi:hypothetical protein
MPGQFNALKEAFRSAMAAAWPEVIPNGIWDAAEALQRSYDGQLALPYAIIDIPTLPVSDRDGICNRAWRPPVDLYYISEVDGDSDALTVKMEAIAEYLDVTPLAVGQLIPPNVTMACGRDLEPNALLILLNATQRAGRVSGTVAVGVTR